MKPFKEFLENHRTHNLIVNVKDQYLNFGGQSGLGISLRHFQQVSAGTRLPTENLIERISNQIPKSEYKALVTAYFKCKLENQCRSNLLQFLDRELPNPKSDHQSIWNQKKPQMFLSDIQMRFLIDNPKLLKFYFLLSLIKQTSNRTHEISLSEQKQLLNLDLIQIDNNEITPTKDLLRIPTFETSNPSSTALGIELIMKALDVFIDKRGSQKQVTGFTLHFVPKEVLPEIDDQIDRLRRLVKSCGSDIDGNISQQIPIMFSTFMKQLTVDEVQL
jgi:hypothetical protein